MGLGNVEAERGENALDVGVGHVHPKQAGHARAFEDERCCRLRSGVDVLNGAAGLAGANLLEQLAGARHRPRRCRDIHAAFEARGGVSLQPERLAGGAHRRRLEVRRFKDDALRAGRHFRIRAAHDAADRLRLRGVSNHQHAGRERTHLAVERLDRFTGLRLPDHDGAATKLGEVEGVHRLSEFEQHVVGDVNDVADRADAAGGEAVLQPLR